MIYVKWLCSNLSAAIVFLSFVAVMNIAGIWHDAPVFPLFITAVVAACNLAYTFINRKALKAKLDRQLKEIDDDLYV